MKKQTPPNEEEFLKKRYLKKNNNWCIIISHFWVICEREEKQLSIFYVWQLILVLFLVLFVVPKV